MKKTNKMTPKGIVLLLVLAIVIGLFATGCSDEGGIQEVLTDEEYVYVDPDESKAEPDEGIVIDGVLDEAVYQNNNWLYLHNNQGNDVDIAMTSYYGEKGMYFVYDVTESVPIYVNLNRASYLNSCIEMYFAPSSVTSLGENSVFEIDMLPTGDMVFKKSNGKGGYVNVATTDDIMAYLGATTKGGEINTGDCYGYCLELFIPWDYMEWIGMDAQAMKESFVYVDPAHITSYNLTGTDTSVDRYWYFFAQQQGATFANVFQYFRFDGTGVLGTVPVEVTGGENCAIEADPNVIPGVKTTITVKPEDGFAVNSVLVNGEEYIQSASYNADGSVELVIRPGEEGLKISAAAEAVSDGTKTLSGTVRLANIQEDTLEGVLASYKGPTGEKPIELDENGSFRLEGLEQGYYTLEIQKEGYQGISRGIYLNRDIDAELVLEFDTFFTQNGSAFVLDEQNSNVVHKFGGTGYIMSNESYDRFTYEMNIRYDEELAKEAETDAFVQQRTGMRILFSNGKYWYIDMLKEGDSYIVQYAKHSNAIFDKWTTICKLNAAQIAKYTGEEGITLKVVRDGRFAAVYLGGKLLRVEKLGNEYAGCTAQLGMESWSANRGVLEIPYSITDKTSVYVPGSAFYRGGNWDITGQYAGYVTLPGGGDGGWLNFGEKYADSDVSIVVKDDPKVEDKAGGFRTVIKYTFDNGKTASFSVFYNENSEYVIQSMGDTIFGWGTHHKLTAEEVAKLQGDGIELRVVRIGTEISCYLDGKEIVSGADLTLEKSGEASGITADMPATVAIRHYGDQGAAVAVSYKMDAKPDCVKVASVPDAAGNQVALNKDSYVRGDIVILSDSGEGSHYPYAMKVNGETVTLDAEGQYSFEAVEDEYTVEGEYAERIFRNADEWNEVAQNVGVLTIPDSDGDTNWLNSYRSDYQNFDFKVTLRDHNNADDNYRAAVRLGFANDEYVTFTITNDRVNDDATTVYELQNMGGTLHNWALPGYTLNETQVAAIQSEAGLEFRIVRVGDVVDVFVGGEHAHEFDLSAGDVAHQGAQIRMRFYGNTGKDVEVPFTIGEKIPAFVTVNAQTDKNGTVTVMNKNVLPGEKVTLAGAANEGYYCGAVTVDGTTSAAANTDGTYSFVATQQSHTVKGVFYKLIFKDDNANWNAYRQHEGVMVVKNTGNTGYVSTYDPYNQFTLTIHDPDGKIDGFGVAGQFVFENGKIVNVQVTKWKGNYYIKSANKGSIFGGNRDYLVVKDGSELHSKITGNGIKLTAVRAGTELILLADGERLTGLWRDDSGLDLSKDIDGNATGITADMPAKVEICSWCKANIELPFELKTEQPACVTVTIPAMTNGTVTADKRVYLPGDTVKLTVSGDSGYYHTGLSVNGEKVTVSADGTYSFVATASSYNVACGFAEGVFVEGSANWNLVNQNVGVLSVPAETTGKTDWLETKDNWNELSLIVKDYAGGTVNEYAVVGQLCFSNGKYVTVRLIRNLGSDNYTLQCMNDNIFKKWTHWHTLTAQQAAKVQGEGIEFRMTRIGTTLNLYLDDVLVKKLDLTTNNSGVTADMPCVAKIRCYNSNGYDVALPFELANPEQKVTVSVTGTANGTVTADKASYLVGDTVTLTVKPASGYAYNTLTVDGKTVPVSDSGSYSFTAEKDTHEVTASFVEGIFVDYADNNWNLIKQNEGYLTIPADKNGAGWMQTKDNYNKLSLTVKDYAGGAVHEYAVVGQLYFSNGKYTSIRLIYNKNDNKYYLQSMGDSVANWATHHTLTAEQAAKIQGDGIEFAMVRIGTTLNLYLDDVLVKAVDLTGRSSGITADMTCVAKVRYYNSKGYDVKLPFAVSNPDQAASIHVADAANGTITANKTSCKVGDTVTLTVKADSGYAYETLLVDGKALNVGADGTATFKVTKDIHNVTGTFGEGVFVENTNWNLTLQNHGVLSVPATVTGNTDWMNTKGNWNELSITVKDYSGGTKHEYAAVGSFYFTNGKHASIRLISFTDSGKYVLQSMGDSPFNWKTHYTLTAEQVAKVQGEGIKVTMTRRGTRLDLYLDGVAVATNLDLTGRSSGITPDMTCIARVRYYNAGYAAEMPFELGNPDQTVTLNITAENGTVTTDKSSYLVGETVKLTVKGNSGYYYSGVTVNGKPVELDWNGNYSFKATENTCNVVATFAPGVFKDTNKDLNYFKQNAGILSVPSSDGDTGWIDSASSAYKNFDLTLTLRDQCNSDDNYRGAVRIVFSNGKYVTFTVTNDRLNTDATTVYELQNMGGSYFNWKYTGYVLTAEQTAAIQSGEGVQFRILREGNVFSLYIGGEFAYQFELPAEVTDLNAQIVMRFYGNKGKAYEIPYVLN